MGLPKTFAQKFDSSNKEHVLWLKEVCSVMNNSEGPVDELALQNVWLQNGLNIQISPKELMSCAEVHFVLCMKYTTDLMNGSAWIPPPQGETSH